MIVTGEALLASTQSVSHKGRAEVVVVSPIKVLSSAVTHNGPVDLDGALSIDRVAILCRDTLEARCQAGNGRTLAEGAPVIVAVRLAEQARDIENKVETPCGTVSIRSHPGEIQAGVGGREDDTRRKTIVACGEANSVVVSGYM